MGHSQVNALFTCNSSSYTYIDTDRYECTTRSRVVAITKVVV
jgi:hypothetical protein